jgi:polysaccharide export outer membrane protein
MTDRTPAGRTRAASLCCAMLVALATGLAACATPTAPPPEEVSVGAFSPDSPDYVIGPADVLRVSVWRSPELSADVPVRPDGRISLPLLADVHAAGLTTSQLREKLAEQFAEFVSAPDVAVIVQQVNSKRIHIVGEVSRPTTLPLTTEMRVLDAIAAVGGFTPFADRRRVRVLRPAGEGAVTEYRFNYPAFIGGKYPETNFILIPGDTIVVPD